MSARVAFGTAVAAALISLIAAVVSLAVADRLIQEHEDRRLRVAAAVALREIAKEHGAGAAIEDESAELAPEGIRLTVRRAADGTVLGGDAQMPDLIGQDCSAHDVAGRTLRTCAAGDGALRVVAATVRAPRSLSAILLACSIAVAVSAVAAAFLGRRTSRWALAPLDELTTSLGTIAALEPRRAVLAGDDSCTEIAAMRAALSDLLTRLADALDGARRFSADAAHELKTPLTTITAELDLLAEEPLEAPSAAAVERLRTRVALLARLVERLLLLTNASTPAELAVETVALEDVVRGVVDRLAPSAAARIEWTQDVPGMVRGDELLLTALVENVVDNALKFSGEAPVRIVLAETDGNVVLDVSDEGPGLGPEERARAFAPFYRSPSSRASTPGHGVGLAIVAQIAKAHRGSAELIERADGATGARLRATLPAWRAG